MSRYSGKCDLFDHISGQGGWFDKEGNPVEFGDENVYCYYSDEMLDFIAFKKRTGGVLHQHKQVKINEWNQDEVAKYCSDLTIIPHTKVVEDKRYKKGKREVTTYTYKYWNREYTLKELNKHGVWVTIDIHFDTILDLIPYYPYIVSFCSSKDGKEVVYITDQSFVIEERDGHIEHGYFSDFWEHYTKELQNHYREIVLEYFNPIGRERHELITFTKEGDKYLGHTQFPIDDNFEPRWMIDTPFWNSPKVIDEHTLEMSKENFKEYIGDTVRIYYVRKKDNVPLRLD